jgi:hypothetical protein
MGRQLYLLSQSDRHGVVKAAEAQAHVAHVLRLKVRHRALLIASGASLTRAKTSARKDSTRWSVGLACRSLPAGGAVSTSSGLRERNSGRKEHPDRG